MASVYDIADFFIELAGQDEEGEITNMKLNKLLYFVQGHSLAKTGKPLFNDSIEAWEWGPVVPAVYHKYKICGSGHIAAIGKEVAASFSDEELSVLLDTAREYCKYTAAYLVKKTHEPGAPWAKTEPKGKIDNSCMTDYFSHHEKIVPFDEIFEKKNHSPQTSPPKTGEKPLQAVPILILVLTNALFRLCGGAFF